MNGASNLALDRPILIGGSSSSGTSLLSVLLDTHPAIGCGPELSVFNKARLYGDFTLVRRQIAQWIEHGVSTDGFTEYRPFFFKREAYGATPERLTALATDASSLREFFDAFFSSYLQTRGKHIWAEKTPSNVYCFRHFLELYPCGNVIHVIRDGRDVLCSLMARFRCAYRSASTWLYNVAAGLACRGLPGYIEVRYEELVTQPERTVRELCARLDVDYEPSMLETQRNRHRGAAGLEKWHACWRNSPISGEISDRSVGRWRSEMTPALQRVFDRITLTAAAAEQFGCAARQASHVLAELGYASHDRLGKGAALTWRDRWAEWRWNASRAVREARADRRWWRPLTRTAAE